METENGAKIVALQQGIQTGRGACAAGWASWMACWEYTGM